MCIMEIMWDIPFSPKPWAKIPTYHKPCPQKKTKKRKFPIKESEESKKRKFPIEECEKAKKGKKILDQRSEENRRNIQKGLWTRRHLNKYRVITKSKYEKKGNHDLKWSSPFDCQPKSCASVTCSPHTKQKQKRKKSKTLKAKVPTK